MDARKVLERAVSYGAGAADSPAEVLLGLYKLLDAGRGREGEELLPSTVIGAAGERILVLARYSGFARNMSAFLEIVADRVTRIPNLIGMGLDKLRSCIISIVSGYIEDAITKTYDYCRGIEGNTLIIPRGTLAYACALGVRDSPLEGEIYVPIGGGEMPPIFNTLRPKTVYWQTAYQHIERGEIKHVVSQLEFASHMGFVASLGTTEFSLVVGKNRAETQMHLVGLLLSSFPGVMPTIESIPTVRLKTADVVEEEYPILEIARWDEAGPSSIILDGSPTQLKLPVIKARIKRVVGAMASRLEDTC